MTGTTHPPTLTDTPLYDGMVAEYGDVPADVAALEIPPPPDIMGPAEEAGRKAAEKVARLANRPRDEHGRFLPENGHEDDDGEVDAEAEDTAGNTDEDKPAAA